MRVLYIHHCGAKGGSSTSLMYLLKELPASIEKHVITVDGPVAELFREITHHVYAVKKLPQIGTVAGADFQIIRNIYWQLGRAYLKQVRRLIQEIQPDIVHLNEVTSVLLAPLAKESGAKVICHIRVVPDHRYGVINKIVKKLLLKYVDHVIAIDNSAAKSYRELPLSVVYNPFKTVKNPDRINNTTGEAKFVFCSNFLKQKGIFEVIDAAKKLKQNDHIKFLIAGGNTNSDRYYKSVKGKLLSMLNITPNVEKQVRSKVTKENLTNVLLLGHVNDIEGLFRESDVLLFPSYMNEPSRSVFEAGVFGVPAIVAMRDIVEDIVEDGKTGFIIPQRNSTILADKILLLANNQELRLRLGQAAKEKYSFHHTPQRAAQQVLLIYKNILQRN